VKVTLSLPDELLSAVDEYLGQHGKGSRSGVCADALRAWIKGKQEEEIEAYYRSLSPDDEAEDRAWHDLAARSAAKLWP